MMLSKKEWASSFVTSDKYKSIVHCIENLPYPDYRATFTPFNGAENPTISSQRLKFYLKKIIPLTAFYYVDYIDSQTNGEEIINVCDSDNLFAGMYNIKLWNGSNSFYNPSPLPLLQTVLTHENRYDNVMCVCEQSCAPLGDLEKLVAGFANTIKKDKVGYGYLAFDSHRARAMTRPSVLYQYDLKKYYRLNQFIDDAIENALKHCDIISYENIIEDIDDNSDDIDIIDGDVRVLFKTRPSVVV